jgi:hypothetical protein
MNQHFAFGDGSTVHQSYLGVEPRGFWGGSRVHQSYLGVEPRGFWGGSRVQQSCCLLSVVDQHLGSGLVRHLLIQKPCPIQHLLEGIYI